MEKELKKIVNSYGIEESAKREEVMSALKFWHKVLDAETFKVFKHVAEVTHYYGIKKLIDSFKKIDTDGDNLYCDKETIYNPLKHKSRVETSTTFFGNLMQALDLSNKDSAQDYLTSKLLDGLCILKNKEDANGVCEKIKKLQLESEKLEELLLECGSEINQKKSELNNSEERQNRSRIGGELRQYIEKKKILNSEINLKQSRIEVLTNKINKSNIKRVIIFDDFLCSGSSTIEFITENKEKFIKLSDIKFLLVYLEATESGYRKVCKCIDDNGIDNLFVRYNQISIDIEKSVRENNYNFELFKSAVSKINDEYGLSESKYFKATAIATYMNSPNSNYAFLISNGSKGLWKPLFKRKLSLKEDKKSELTKVLSGELDFFDKNLSRNDQKVLYSLYCIKYIMDKFNDFFNFCKLEFQYEDGQVHKFIGKLTDENLIVYNLEQNTLSLTDEGEKHLGKSKLEEKICNNTVEQEYKVNEDFYKNYRQKK